MSDKDDDACVYVKTVKMRRRRRRDERRNEQQAIALQRSSFVRVVEYRASLKGLSWVARIESESSVIGCFSASYTIVRTILPNLKACLLVKPCII